MSEVEYEQAAFEEAAPEAPRAALGSGTTHDVNPLQVLHQLLRGRYILAIVLALALGAGLGYLGYTIPKPVYRSSGMIRIRPFTSRILYSNERNEMMPMFDAFVDSQVLLMRSQRVTDLAMQSDEWRALKRGSSPEEASDFVKSLDVSRSEGSEIVQVSFTDLNPTAAVVGAKSVIEAYEKIYGESDVGADSRTMQVLEDRRTALTNEIKGYTDRIQMIATEFGSDALEAVYNHKVENLEKVESEWHEAQLAVTRLQPSATQPGATTQAGSATQPAIARLAATQPTLAAAATQKAAVAAATQPAPLTVEEIARQDPTMQNYVSRRRSQQDEIDGMLALGILEKAPRVQHAESALATINKEIADYAKSYVPPPSVAAAVAATRTMSPEEIMEEAKAKEARVHLLYDEDRTEALDLGRKWLQIKALRESADEAKQKLEDTKSRIEQLNLESEGSGRISAVSTGDRPGLPWKDDRKKFGAAGGMAGCLVGLGLTLLLGLADRRLKHSGDTTMRGLRTVNMLGVLPHMPDDILDEKGAAFAAHCVHGIRASLQVGGGAGRSMAYAITSAAAGDGKTSLVTALGMSFAASGTKTLLIDCDLIGGGLSSRLRNIARPRLSAILIGQGLVTKERWKEVSAHAKRQGCTMEEAVVELGILTREALDAAMSKQPERQPGVMDVLEDVPLSTAVQSVGVKGLSVLTLGDAEAHEVTRLSPRKLRQLVQTCDRGYFAVWCWWIWDRCCEPGSADGERPGGRGGDGSVARRAARDGGAGVGSFECSGREDDRVRVQSGE